MHTCLLDAGTELSSGEEEVTRKEEARLRATQRSRDLREKLKKKNPRRERKGSNSDAEPSDDEYVGLCTCTEMYILFSTQLLFALLAIPQCHIHYSTLYTHVYSVCLPLEMLHVHVVT